MADSPPIPGLSDRPSELAEGLAMVARSLSPDAAADVERLLAHAVGLPKPAVLREARLGLLIEMVSDGSGLVPSVRDYLAAREQRRQRGEQWPAPSSLIAAYGSFLTAVKAAMKLATLGTPARVAPSHHHSREPSKAFTRTEAAAALRAFHDKHGYWPRSQEWGDWSALSRRLARQHGRPDPRLPNLTALRRLFGTFERAIVVARRASGP